ncbi:unnamed protein product, partial [Polarella glacialis]
PGGLASARRRGWVLEDASTGEAGAGGSACSPPAGAYYQSGSAAAALEAAAVEAEGLNSPAEPLMVAPKLSEPQLHPVVDVEQSCVSPRRFRPLSRRPDLGASEMAQIAADGERMKSAIKGTYVPPHGTCGAVELASGFSSLQLAGLRRQRAASSGNVRGRPSQPPRWRF